MLELCQAADVVFLALHGTCGEDGRVQAAFDLMGIPYTGSGYVGSALAMDKDLTKRLVAPLGVKTPRWQRAAYTEKDVDRLTSTTPVPCVVKPVASGSSIGVSIARTKKGAPRRPGGGGSTTAGSACWSSSWPGGRSRWPCWPGGPCPPLRSSPATGFTTTPTSTSPARPGRSAPPPIPPAWEEAVGQAALTVYRALDLAVYARADFIVDEEGTPWFLEINTLPGMTPHQPGAPGGRRRGHRL